MRRVLAAIVFVLMLAGAPAADARSRADRIEDLSQELASLTEDVEDVQEPVAEFELFEQCAYTIGVTPYGRRDGSRGYVFGARRRPALAIDIRGFDSARYLFLAFPAEEPPSIECNEDAGEEETDDDD